MKAFPNPHAFNAESAQLGMDLRDYFAAKAMQSIVSKYGDEPPYLDLMDDDDNVGDKAIAQWAYELADAMMEARK